MLTLLVAVALTFAASSEAQASAEPAHFSVEVPVDRARKTFRISITRGGCVVDDETTVEDTYAGADVAVQAHAYKVTAKVKNTVSGACAGVGLDDLHETLRLPGKLGRRALISDGGKGSFHYIIVPPVGRGAIRELVDRKKHPGNIYVDSACNAVKNAFRGVPKSRWCFY